MDDDRFIKGIRIDWNRVKSNNYVRSISSIQSMNQLMEKVSWH
jgi:hypothetical protein